jgi:hypothetical protein
MLLNITVFVLRFCVCGIYRGNDPECYYVCCEGLGRRILIE